MTLNKDIIFTAMEKAVRNTFETILFIDFDKATEIKTPGYNMTDQVTFIKVYAPIGGELYLVIGYDLAFEIIKSLYNEKDENVIMLLVDEIMAEICNTVTGRFMAEIVPPDKEFNFSLPTCTKIEHEKVIHNFEKNIYALEFIHREKPVYCMFRN